MQIPKIISVDDHILEPPGVWTDRLPSKYHDRGPRLVRKRAVPARSPSGMGMVESDDGNWTDVWLYDDLAVPLLSGLAAADAPTHDMVVSTFVTYDDIAPGCWQQAARLEAMDRNRVEASLCFPTFPRFCGQTFLEREDKELALLCVHAYNDFMIDEWCGGAATGRLIPLTLIPLWDAELAAAEIHRCADKGSHAVCFSEGPQMLGLPSVYSGSWDPFFQACDETETVINMHIGSSSTMLNTSPEMGSAMVAALNFVYIAAAFGDWLLAGVLAKFPNLKIALSEGQAGWMPYMQERLDGIWERGYQYDVNMRTRVPEPPSSYVPGRIFGCVYDDVAGLRARDQIGMGQIMFEVDYPHADSNYPHSVGVAEKLSVAAGLNEHETWQLVRGNAINCYGLSRFGITE